MISDKILHFGRCLALTFLAVLLLTTPLQAQTASASGSPTKQVTTKSVSKNTAVKNNTAKKVVTKKPAAKKQVAKKQTTAKKKVARKSRSAPAAVTPLESSPKYASLVIEAQTGRILSAANADRLRHPASLTKMMTLYMMFQALEAGRLRLDQRLPVSSNAAAQSPSKLGLRTGQTISVQDAILGLVTESANDAAVVVAEALAGSEAAFGQMMTRQARALGMTKSVFHNPSGLPNSEQVTTARDMVILGYALIHHYPRYYPMLSRASFTYNGIRHDNHNRLMQRYAGMDGIKTGYIRASGFNLVSSAVQNNTRLIGVVFGGRSAVSRDNHMAQLLDQAFASLPRSGRAALTPSNVTEAEGDSNQITDPDYIPLPGKVAAVFVPPTAAVQRAAELPRSEGALQRETRLGLQPSPLPAQQPNLTNWGVQIGAFSDPAIGKQALANIVKLNSHSLTGADQILQKITANDGSAIYRARFMGMTESNARNLCAAMTQQRQNCLLVTPQTVAGY